MADTNNNGEETTPDRTIFLVHNNASAREAIQACLSDLGGWDVFSFATPKAAFQEVTCQCPDAILIALPLPRATTPPSFKLPTHNSAKVKVPILFVLERTKWADLKLIHQHDFGESTVAGSIDALSDPVQIPEQIKRALNW